jgi:hypothetical protein
MFLIDFVKSLLPHLTRPEIFEDIRITQAELSTVVLPSYAPAVEHFKVSKLISEENKELEKLFNQNYRPTSKKKSLNFISEIATRLPEVLANLNATESSLNDVFGADIITSALTAKKAVLLRAVDQISFMSIYSVGLLNVIYYNEAMASGVELSDKMAPDTIVMLNTKKYMAAFAGILSIYGDDRSGYLGRIGKIPDVRFSEVNADLLRSVYNEKTLDPFSESGVCSFRGNPIYHVRLIVLEWQEARYSMMQDKKKALELRLLQLKLLQDRENDAGLENQIVYIQGRINKLEYKMAKMES